jgi:hypothetical protein
LLRLARAAPAQRRLVASAAQQEREARAAAAQRRAAQRRAAQRRLVAYWTRFLKLQYEDALAAPLPAHLATLITPTRNTGRERLNADRRSSYARARVSEEHRAAAVNGRAMSALIRSRLIYLRCVRSGCEQSQQGSPLFDHLIGTRQQRCRYFEPNRSSYFVGNCTGNSAGLAPFRIRSTYDGACWNRLIGLGP